MGKHANVKRWEKYDDEGNFEGKKCPRCDSLIAQHGNRESCGNCGYTKIQK
ncbi:MAG: 30S ribosomal protein S27ae [Candidatus Nanohaloarchaeota archaeon QJJ-9]|nr:30S ribosomal protein S27ae [Candidatus Nanohaloarchaeota archaeon QJJ-9]